MHPQKHFLHHIFGVVRIAQDSIGDFEDEACMLANGEFEVRELICAIEHQGLLRKNWETGWICRHCSPERRGSPFSSAKTVGVAKVFGFLFREQILGRKDFC
jgi:hypothetical protein